MLCLALTLSIFSTSALAASCKAVGVFTVNSAGFGDGGTTSTMANGLNITRNGEIIGTASNPCYVDGVSINSELPSVFEWQASCENVFLKCSGKYGSQTNLKGSVKKGTNFYGLGESVSSACTIDFAC